MIASSAHTVYLALVIGWIDDCAELYNYIVQVRKLALVVRVRNAAQTLSLIPSGPIQSCAAFIANFLR